MERSMSCPVIKLTMQLIRCPSISPDDGGCQAIIINRLKKIGFNIECMDFDDTKNLWAWRGRGKTLTFAGHTDVVPIENEKHWITPPFKPTIFNNNLFGRGAVDMKGSIAAMIVAAERFVAAHPNHTGRLAFLITSDEESEAKNGTIKVIEELMKRNEQLDYCLIGEPSSTEVVGDVIKNGRRGSLTCNMTIYGKQGHVAYPNLADNPIQRSISMLSELLKIQWDQGNTFFPPTNMQITKIHSGSNSSNIIPSDLFLQLNFRFSNELTDNIIKSRVSELLKKHHLRHTMNWFLSGNPFLAHCDTLINAVIKSIFRFSKIKPKLSTDGGTSDGRFITRMGTQILELGLINKTVHKMNECVSITDLQLLTDIYQDILGEMLPEY